MLCLFRRAQLGFIILTPGVGNWGSVGTPWGQDTSSGSPAGMSPSSPPCNHPRRWMSSAVRRVLPPRVTLGG